MAGAIPSTLHQKIKFRIEKSIVTVNAKEDIMVIQTSNTPCIKVAEEAYECAFRSFKIAEVSSEQGAYFDPHVQTLTQIQMTAKGLSDGKGLRKDLHGRYEIVELTMHDDTFGLGFKHSRLEKI